VQTPLAFEEVAMNTLLTAGAQAERGADRAARAIVALINSRPYSPRPDEIAAIIEKLATDPTPARPAPSSLDEYGPDLTILRP
jgi:hypothetical protein